MVILLGDSPFLGAEQPPEQKRERILSTALVPGPYRSYASLFVDLAGKDELLVWHEDEVKLYRDLIRRSFQRDYLVVEATGYPLAALSAWMETEQNAHYHQFDIGDEFNLLRSLGAGSQEPWSMSLFLGQLLTYWSMDDQDELVIAARGAAGMVATAGLQQLFDNCIVDAPWTRIEWKVKGEGSDGPRERYWDLKVGHRWYGLAEIPNTLTFTLERGRTNRERFRWKPAQNSISLVQLQMPTTELQVGLTRVLFEYAKFVPVRKHLVGLKVGFLYENRKTYDARSQSFDDEKEKSWELVIQPMAIF
ncbi:MAG: hypothetical protein JSU61_01210 [Fidelibacterota bacterium]|nr:MAG: hypothetical protein JSU61_01210 [Candidatus Neomarinimicrobiota bacterium]